MIRKSLLFVLCALTLVSCSFQHILSEEEYNALDKATLDFDIDWSDLEEEPKGCTLYFFPCDDNPIDTTIYHYSFNKVNHVRVYLPDQDYSVICFNRSETEFADLKFDISSFKDAKVMAKSDEESAHTTVRYGKDTRAYNAQSTLRPKSFASASQQSVKTTLSRAYNAQTTLNPKGGIKGMSISINVFGLNSGVRVSGTLTNLSAGLSLCDGKPLEERMNQFVVPDSWSISLPTDSTKPGSVSTSFGTFGVPTSSTRAMTRAEGDEDMGLDSLLRNMLELTFLLPDGDTVQYDVDVTDVVKAEFERILEQENDSVSTPDPDVPDEIVVEVGDKNDTEGSNESKTDGETPSGTLILHKTQTGTNVKVSDWKEHIIDLIL